MPGGGRALEVVGDGALELEAEVRQMMSSSDCTRHSNVRVRFTRRRPPSIKGSSGCRAVGTGNMEVKTRGMPMLQGGDDADGYLVIISMGWCEEDGVVCGNGGDARREFVGSRSEGGAAEAWERRGSLHLQACSRGVHTTGIAMMRVRSWLGRAEPGGVRNSNFRLLKVA